MTASVLGAGIVAAVPEAALAVNPPQEWRTPRTGTDAFAKNSTVLTPAFAANLLSSNGNWFTFLQLDVDTVGTGKVWQHKRGDAFSTYISKAKGGAVAFGQNGNPLGVRSESSNSGSQALTFVNPDTQTTEVNLTACGSYAWCYPQIPNGTMSQGVDDTGQYVLYGQTMDALSDNGTPSNPADDYPVGGTLFRMDKNITGNLQCASPCKRWIQVAGPNFPTGQSIGGVTSAAFAAAGAGNVYYSQFDAAFQTQRLKYQATVAVNTAGTDVALPAPFNGTPYPSHLSIQVIDESPNANYMLFGVVDESGVIDGGTPHYYVRKNNAPVEYREPPLAPAGQPAFMPTSVDNSGNVGVAQTTTDATPIEPKVVKWDGNIWPVGPAEDRSAHDGVAFTTLSGDGSTVAYPTALPVNAFDTNGLDDFVSVQMSQVPSPPMGHLPTANGGPNKTVAEGSNVTVNASASSSNDAGQPILKYRFDLDNNGSIDQEGTKSTFAFNAGDGPATRTVGVSVVDPDGTSPTAPVTVTVNNVAPVITQANVTPRTGTVGTTQFTYTIQSVTDAGGDPVSVAWDVNNDGTTDLTGQNPAPYVFSQSGTFVGNVKATDKDGATATVSLPTVTVSGVTGNLPTANPGPNQTVDEGATVTINASASSANDAGQSIGTYIFDKGRDGTIDQQSANPVYNFTAPNGPSTVQVGVRVVDPDGTSPEAVATITVNNAAPVITGASVAPTSGTPNVTDFSYSATVTDPGGDTTTVQWDFDGDGTFDYTGTTPPARKFAAAGTYTGTVKATDSDGATATSALPTVTVSDPGHAPTANAGGNKTVGEGSTVTIDASASSANDAGQTISSYRFDLGNDGTIDQQGASPTFAFPAGNGPGTKVVAVTVVDPDGTSAPDVATITVNNLAPQIAAPAVTPDVGTTAVTAFTYSATVTDPGGDPTTVQWDFDGDGTFDFTGPTPPAHVFSAAGTYAGAVKATDDASASTTVALPSVIVSDGTPVTHPPTANAGGNKTVDEGSTVTIDASASSANDAGQTISSYRFDLGNDGTIDQQGASPTFAFPAGDGPSTKVVAVTVVDPDATSAPDVATITVNNVAPSIGSATVSPASGFMGATVFGYSASGVSDPGGDSVTVTWDFDGNGTTDATGLLATNTFATRGTYNGVAKATDKDGGVTTVALAPVTVTGHPPTANAGGDQTVNEGATVVVNASASSANDPGDTISSYRFDLGNDGTIDQQGPSASFSFPAGDGPSTKTVAVTVVDPDATSTPALATITVNNVPPVIGNASVTPTSGFVVDQQFDYAATGVSDPGGDPVTLAWDFDGNGTTDATGPTRRPTSRRSPPTTAR
ncbi:MAG: PKD domain-containing protein [Acidimicrobiia bacterium]